MPPFHIILSGLPYSQNIADRNIIEAPWFSPNSPDLIRLPTSTGRTVAVDRLDMRLEDMRRYGGVQIKDIYQWLAPLPDGTYLTHDHGVVPAAKAKELGWWVLPADWWQYALGTRDGQIVKAPAHPRPGEPTQEEADQGLPATESYLARLDRALCRPSR